MENECLISIIIPVFNREKTIRACIESIVNQDLSQVELIIINDASSDNTLHEVKDYTVSIPSIKVITLTKNQGPGLARNEGIKLSKGKYITFVDSDDTVDSKYVISLKNAISKYRCDLILFDYKRVYHRKKSIVEKHYPYSSSNTEKDIVQKDIINLYHSVEVSSVIKVIKKEVLMKEPNIRFPDSLIAEDLYFSLLLYPHIQTFVMIPEVLYCYHLRENSQSRMVTDWSGVYISLLKKITDFYRRRDEFEKYYPGLEYILTKHLLLPNLLRFYRHRAPENYQYLLSIRSVIMESFPTFTKNPYLNNEPFYSIITLWLIRYFPKVFKRLVV